MRWQPLADAHTKAALAIGGAVAEAGSGGSREVARYTTGRTKNAERTRATAARPALPPGS